MAIKNFYIINFKDYYIKISHSLIIMTTKFDKPYMERNNLSTQNIGNLFNYADSLDLEGLRRESLTSNTPLNIINEQNENLIYTVLKSNIKTPEEKRLKIIKFLVSKGVNPDLSNYQNISPLHLACGKQLKTIIEYLVADCGCNPNVKDNFGKTPIHYLISGLIVPWENKKNEPFLSLPQKSSKKIFESKIALKNEIYKILNDLNINKQLNDFINNLDLSEERKELSNYISDNLELESDTTLENLAEKRKTLVKNLSNRLNFLDINNSILNFKDIIIDNSTEGTKIKSEYIIYFYIIEEINKLKNSLNQEISKNEDIINQNMEKCKFTPDLIKNFKTKSSFKNYEEYSLTKISPFYPYLFKHGNNYFFVSNSETEIAYQPYPKISDLYNKINTTEQFIYYLFNESYKNDGSDITDDFPDDLSFEIGEKINSIKQKLMDNSIINESDEQNKLKSFLLISLFMFIYSPSLLSQLKNLNYSFTNSKYQFIIKKFNELLDKNLFIEFIFEVFYYLIEQNIINKNNKKIYDTSLYLVKCLIYKNFLFDEKIAINKKKIFGDNLDNFPPNSNDDSYYEVRESTEEKNLIDEFNKKATDHFNLIQRDEYKKIDGEDQVHADIYLEEKNKIYFTQIYRWIQPTVKELFEYHYLVDNLDEYEMNQGIFTCKIINSVFLSKTDKIEINDSVSTSNPKFTNIDTQPKSNKKYLTGNILENLLIKILCKFMIHYNNIINYGKFPLKKVLSLENSKFEKYFARVVPYHLRSLMLLENNFNEIFGLYIKINKYNLLKYDLNPVNINFGNYHGFINLISIYNYFIIRFTKPTTELNLIIPNFYYYSVNDEIPQRILSYTNDSDGINEEKIELTKENNIIKNLFLKPKIKIGKLRISRNTLPPSIKTKTGYNILLNLTLLNIISKLNLDEKLNDFIDQQGITFEQEEYKKSLIKNITTELLNEILEKQIKLIAIDKILNSTSENTTFLQSFKGEVEQDITFLKSTDIKIERTIPKQNPSLFPIIKTNDNSLKSNLELYFSNDYTSETLANELFEIKFNNDALKILIKYGSNPFMVDNQEQSPINLLTTNYLYSPLETLKDIGVDLRQPDEYGYNFNKKLAEEIEYHKSFINTDKKNFREIINDLIEPHYKNIESQLDKFQVSRFNQLRYTRLALEMTAYYLLVNPKNNLINLLPSDVYVSDMVLANHLLNPESSMPKTKELIKTIGPSINLEEFHNYFHNTFKDSPGVFLDNFENIIKNNKLINDLEEINLTDGFSINYFTKNRYLNENEELQTIFNKIMMVNKEVLTTQIIYLLTNLINAHLKMKYPLLNQDDIIRIIEEDILGAIITEREEAQNLLDIIKNEMIPKLFQNMLKIYDTKGDEYQTEYSVFDMTNEIKAVLLLISKWFDEDDKLLNKVFPEFLNNYLETYLNQIIPSIGFIAENIMKWKINYVKLQKLKE